MFITVASVTTISWISPSTARAHHRRSAWRREGGPAGLDSTVERLEEGVLNEPPNNDLLYQRASYPTLAAHRSTPDADWDRSFTTGLSYLLDGLAANG